MQRALPLRLLARRRRNLRARRLVGTWRFFTAKVRLRADLRCAAEHLGLVSVLGLLVREAGIGQLQLWRLLKEWYGTEFRLRVELL